jgi:hypothetical protein
MGVVAAVSKGIASIQAFFTAFKIGAGVVATAGKATLQTLEALAFAAKSFSKTAIALKTEIMNISIVAASAALRTKIAIMTAIGTIISQIISIGIPLLLIAAAVSFLISAFWSIAAAVKSLIIVFSNLAINIGKAFGMAAIGIVNELGKAIGRLADGAVAGFNRMRGAIANMRQGFMQSANQMYHSYTMIVKALQSGEIGLAMNAIKLEAVRQLIYLEIFARRLLGHLLNEVPNFMISFINVLKLTFEGIGNFFKDLFFDMQGYFRIIFAEIKSIAITLISDILDNFNANFGFLVPGAFPAQVKAKFAAIDAQQGVELIRKQVDFERGKRDVEKFAPDRIEDFIAGENQHMLANRPGARPRNQDEQAKIDFFLNAVKGGLRPQFKLQMPPEMVKAFADMKDNLQEIAKGDPEFAMLFAEFMGIVGNGLNDVLKKLDKLQEENDKAINNIVKEREFNGREGKSEEQIVAEKELKKLYKEREQLNKWGVGEDVRKELEEKIKEQERIIRNEKSGRGIGDSGQPVVRSAEDYLSQLKEMKKWAGDDPKKQALLEQVRQLAILAGRYHHNKGRFTDDEGGESAKEQLKRFNELRTQAYINRGLSEKDAKQLIDTENRNSRAEYIRRDIESGKERIATLKEERKQLPKDDISRRTNLLEVQREAEKDLRGSQRELDSLFAKEKQRRQSPHMNEIMLDRMFKSTMTFGSFSAYDVIRGGGDRKDNVLNELQKHTGYLEYLPSIAENANQGIGD